MLTCKVGETIINCFDGKYDKYKLKEWSDKNRLICPDCGKPYEYCHGRVIFPYFRHKEKAECESLYSESETEEHLQGKIALYNWLLRLQENGVVENVKLELYISETKQRPDLYFEKDGKRFVIEFQCTPIASEYLERHEIYQLANVNDIWVLGTDKYNLNIRDNDVSHGWHFKTIEDYTNYYYNYKNNKFITKGDLLNTFLQYPSFEKYDYITLDENQFTICNNIRLKQDIIDKINFDILNKIKIKNRITSRTYKLVHDLTDKYRDFDNKRYYFWNKFYDSYQDLEFGNYSKSSIHMYFKIFDNCIECITNNTKLIIEKYNHKEVYSFIIRQISNYLREKKYGVK